MKNFKEEYLLKLLDVYSYRGVGEFICSKLKSIENPVFCYKCSRMFILKVNCTAKFEKDELKIECKRCKTNTKILDSKYRTN